MKDTFKLNKYLLNLLDYKVLEHYFDALLNKKFGYFDSSIIFNEMIKDFPQISREIFEKRLMYLFGLGYIDLEKISSDDDFSKTIRLRCKKNNISPKNVFLKDSIDAERFYEYFLYFKINSLGIQRMEILRSKIRSSAGWRFYYNYVKTFLDDLIHYKYLAVFSITAVCFILIFIFDIKVSGYVSKLPLISSVVDVELLKQFETVNANDEYFKEISRELDIGTGALIEGNSLYKNSAVKDLKVMKISDNEKLFRFTLKNGEEQLVTVNKTTDGKFKMVLPAQLKQRLQNLKNNFSN